LGQLAVPYLTAMIHPVNAASSGVGQRLRMKRRRADVVLGNKVVVCSLGRGHHTVKT
jgi:hypothetical protein